MNFFEIKITRWALIAIFLVSLFSCSEDSVEPTMLNSNFKASKNDESWVANESWAVYSKKERKFYINAYRQDFGNEIEEELLINVEMPDLTAPLSTSSFHSEWLYIIGGDAVSDRYNIDSSDLNEIKITSVDTEKKIVNGYFSIRLIHDDAYIKKGNSFHFTKGYFSVKYDEIDQVTSSKYFDSYR